MKSLLQQTRGPIARGTVRTSAVLGLRLAVQAGTLLLVARMLGPREFGAFAGVAALAVILGTLSTFGTHLVLLGEVSKDPARRADVLPWAIPTTLLCGSALLGIYLLVSTIALGEAGISITVLLAIGIAETLLQPLFGMPTTEHLALGRIARSQLLKVLPLALRLAAAATVFLLHPTRPLIAYGYGYFVASVLALGFATLTISSPWPALRNWRLPKVGELRVSAGYAALNITAAGPAELDKTLAAKLLPLVSAGMYAAGARVIGATILPVMAMLLSALPRLFREGHAQPQRTTRLLHWILAAALGYILLLAAVLWLIAPVFDWIFGAKYQSLHTMIRWLCLALPGMALRIAAGYVLMAIGKPWMRVAFEAFGLVILVVASVVLIAYLGPVGMPLALACSEWSMSIIGGVLVFMQLRLRPKRQTASL